MNKKLTIQLIGNDENQKDVQFGDFIAELRAVNETLKSIEKTVTDLHHTKLTYRVSDLRHQSPATIEIEVISKDTKTDFSEVVINKFMNTLNSITKKKIPENIDMDVLTSYEFIGNSFGRSLGQMRISSNGSSVEIAEKLEPVIKEILGGEEIEYGSISGLLESLNVHGMNRKFTIYPVSGPKKVNCIFPNKLMDIAIQSVTKYINLTGEIKYHRMARFPHEILVKEIEVYPDEDKLPTIFDLKGIAPMATGELKSEEFICEIREGQ